MKIDEKEAIILKQALRILLPSYSSFIDKEAIDPESGILIRADNIKKLFKKVRAEISVY